MIMSQEKHFIKARNEFDALLGWIGQADEEGLRIDQVERGLFSRLLSIGFVLLEAFVAKFGRADAASPRSTHQPRETSRQRREEEQETDGICRSGLHHRLFLPYAG